MSQKKKLNYIAAGVGWSPPEYMYTAKETNHTRL